ncbi:hypothetical protein LSH36_1353g00010 [Paralvinella palmiformis]|uniref:glutathione transferase n=1 Tax=Paralvinella palmiformis TaxID=53620 RepID=A0AAD9IU80_9ANNE|nr:hypothetical protein LSH36_1353g00010 [Paralvinella palmiformis]
MPKYQLMYFDAKGRAELARWLFAAAGQEYEDKRLTFEEWAVIKPSFMGKDEYEEAKCNMVLECCHYDMLPTIVEFLLRDDKTKEEAKKRWEDGERDQYFAKFENLLKSNKNGDGYFVGDGLTVADMWFCILIDYSANDSNLDWSKFPKIAALRERVEKGNKRIAKWIAKRPTTEI